MSDGSQIEWTDATWNPLRGTRGRHYCVKLSPGCDNCYASTMNRRLSGIAYPRAADVAVIGDQIVPKAADGTPTDRVRLDQEALNQPLNWRAPRRVFVCSMTDLFGEWVPDEWLDQLFAVMALTPQHTYQLLTKRPSRMRDYLADATLPDRIGKACGPLCSHAAALRAAATVISWRWEGMTACPFVQSWPLPNVWLGTSIESDAYAWRAKVLSEIPAAVRFVSAEPLLGPLPSLDLERRERCSNGCADRLEDGKPDYCNVGGCDMESPGFNSRLAIDWLIVGGESGGPAERRLVENHRDSRARRYMHDAGCDGCWEGGYWPKPEALEWVRDLRDRATAAGVAFMFKQWGGPTHGAGGRSLDGRTWDEFPSGASR